MYSLGLTTLGVSAATLLCDDEIVAAAKDECFSRREQPNFTHENRELFAPNRLDV